MPSQDAVAEVLLDAITQLLSARDLAAVGTIVSNAARAVVGADGATVVLRDKDECHYLDEAAVSPLWKGRRFPIASCVSGLAMQQGTAVVIDDALVDARVPQELYRETFVTGLALVPGGKPQPVCAIGVYWATHHQASASEIAVLQRLADAMAVAITNILAHDQLAEFEARFRTMADSTPVMIWVHNRTGQLEFVNRAWLIFFGATPEQARDDNWTPLIHPDDREHYVSTFLDCMERGVPFEANARVLRHDGRWRWIASFGAPRFTTDGTCIGMVGSSADITEVKLAWARAEDESRRKEQWLSVVGHELRQPVHAITAALRMLQPDAPPTSQQRARSVVERQVGQMARMLDDLLDTARIVRGDVALTRQVLDLRDVLAEAVDAAAADFEGRGQHVVASVPPEPVLVRIDGQRMQQVIGNLLANASKYSNVGERIAASITVAEGFADLAVVDVGRGIEPEMLPHVFDLFTTVGGDSSSFGVGLAVARRLAELQGGTLHGSSEGAGLGSRFVLRLRTVSDTDPV